MIIAVMSDSHDNIWNLRSGDFIAPFTLAELDQSGIPEEK